MVFLNRDVNGIKQLRIVCHLPDWSKANPYQSLLAAGLARADWRVLFMNPSQGLLPLQKILNQDEAIDVIHLHWIGPYIKRTMSSSSRGRFYAKAALLVVDVLLSRLKGRRVVWTVHNLVGHECPDVRRERILRRLLAKTVSHVIFHSKGAHQMFLDEIGHFPHNRYSIVPHGNYFDVYPHNTEFEERLARQLKLRQQDKVVLFFGEIRQYKGIPRLLRAFRKTTDPDLRLVIAGRPWDEDLRTAIDRASLEDDRIRPYLGFVPRDEVAPLHSLADVVVIPYEKTLTSGSVLLAMSLGKAVILPSSARVLGVPEPEGVVYFDSDDALTDTLDNINRDHAEKMGGINLESARVADWSQIGMTIGRIYNE